MESFNFSSLVRYAAVLVAAMIIGSWFLVEVKKAKFAKQAWYKPYLSIPGLIILAALCLPLLILLIGR